MFPLFFFYRAAESQFICLISSLHIIAWMGVSNEWTLIGFVQAHPAVSVGLGIITLTFTVTLTRWSRMIIPSSEDFLVFNAYIGLSVFSVDWTWTGRQQLTSIFVHRQKQMKWSRCVSAPYHTVICVIFMQTEGLHWQLPKSNHCNFSESRCHLFQLIFGWTSHIKPRPHSKWPPWAVEEFWLPAVLI